MVDYNAVIPTECKIKFLQEAIEKEKVRFSKQFNDNEDPTVQLEMLEEYYLFLKDMNERYHSSRKK